MLVQFGEKTYRVQFVHSSHDGSINRDATPGGLRQLVDNISISLRRRVTLCEISEVQFGALLTSDPASKTPNVYVPVSQGIAVCYKGDQFKKVAGRAFALDRALTNAINAGHISMRDVIDAGVWALFPKENEYLLNLGM
jgi:hypothetical protein